MKRTIKWICLFLCVVLVFGMFAKPALATYASELTNSVIKEKEQEIDKAKQEKKQFEVDTGSMVLWHFCNGRCSSDREPESHRNGKYTMCTDPRGNHCKF